jgi:hypothetical protein
MLCLSDSIRHDDPSLQRLLRAMEDADSLTALTLAAWQVARLLAVHLVEAVLAVRARCPTSWPPCPVCGVPLRSKGFARRQSTSPVRADPVAPTRGTLSAGLPHPAGGPLG